MEIFENLRRREPAAQEKVHDPALLPGVGPGKVETGEASFGEFSKEFTRRKFLAQLLAGAHRDLLGDAVSLQFVLQSEAHRPAAAQQSAGAFAGEAPVVEIAEFPAAAEGVFDRILLTPFAQQTIAQLPGRAITGREQPQGCLERIRNGQF